MDGELTHVATRLGHLVAENDAIARQPRRARTPEMAHRRRRNELAILECQIVLQAARIAARPPASATGLERGLATLYRRRDAAARRLKAHHGRTDTLRQVARQGLAFFERS